MKYSRILYLNRFQPNKKILIAIFILLTLNILLYLPSLHHDFLKDDFRLIVENPRIKSFSSFISSLDSPFFSFPDYPHLHYWRPLSLFSFYLDYSLYHLTPTGYHLTNILINALNAILIFFFLYGFTTRIKYGFVSALFFSIHPCHVEAASWISGRTDLLGALFILTATLFFTLFIIKPQHHSYFYLISIFSFILALLAKENSVLFPFLILTMLFIIPQIHPAYLTYKTFATPWKKILLTLPFFLLDFFYIFIHNQFSSVQDVVSQFSLSHIVPIIKTAGAYTKTILFPFFPSPHFSMHQFDASHTPYLIYFLIGIIFFLFIYKKKIYYHPTLYSLLFLFFLLPVLDPEIVPSYPKIVIRFAYIPAVITGIFFLDTLYFIESKRLKKIFITFITLIAFTWTFQSITFQRYFKDQSSHYNGLITFDPDDASLLLPLSLLKAQQGDYDKALSLVNHALDVNLNDPWLDVSEMGGLLKANLLILSNQKEPGKSLAEKILANTKNNDMKYFAHLVIAKYHEKSNNLPQAMAELNTAASLGQTPDLFYRQAVIAGKMQQFTIALDFLEKAYDLNPELPRYHEFKQFLEHQIKTHQSPSPLPDPQPLTQ